MEAKKVDYTQIHSQIIESAIPALVEKSIPEFHDANGDIIEAPEKIYSVWAENFPAIIDIVRYFRANENCPKKVKPITDSDGDIAGYFLHFDTLTDINSSISNSGKKYDMMKKQLKALTEKSNFIIRRKVKGKSKIVGARLTSLIKDIRWNTEENQIRIEISDFMVLFNKAELRLRSVPSNLREIWGEYSHRKAHHCRAYLWCIHNIFSKTSISKVKFMCVCGLDDMDRNNRKEKAYQGCLDFMIKTKIIESYSESDKGIITFVFNKMMLPHLDKKSK